MADVPLPFGLAVAELAAAVGDTSDPGRAPDAVPLSGTAVFTGSQKRFVAGGTIYLPQKITATVTDGQLAYLGDRGVPLTANVVGGEQQGWQWSVAWTLALPDGTPVALDGWAFDVAPYTDGDASTETDLSTFTPLLPPAPPQVFVKGDAGPGIPRGGTVGQIVVKAGPDDFDTEWADPAAGSGAVASVNGKTGAVVLGASDVGAYAKPGSGIPKADLASAVQASLGKADTALQSAPVASVAGKTGAVSLVKADVGLGNVDNTADASKPVSTAQQAAINARVPSSLVTAKGDLIGATGAGVPARLPVGSDGQVLSADSGSAAGVKWIPAPSGGGSPLPAQAGQAGKFLTTDGTAPSWGTPSGGGGARLLLHRHDREERRLAVDQDHGGQRRVSVDRAARQHREPRRERDPRPFAAPSRGWVRAAAPRRDARHSADQHPMRGNPRADVQNPPAAVRIHAGRPPGTLAGVRTGLQRQPCDVGTHGVRPQWTAREHPQHEHGGVELLLRLRELQPPIRHR